MICFFLGHKLSRTAQRWASNKNLSGLFPRYRPQFYKKCVRGNCKYEEIHA